MIAAVPNRRSSVAENPASAGDPLSPGYSVIEVRVTEVTQLFNSIDPSPFGDRDLDPKAEDFIVSRARETPRHAALALRVHLDRSEGPDEPPFIGQAVRNFFGERAASSRRRLRQLFRVGRSSAVIGLIFLALLLGAGEVMETALAGKRLGIILRESFLIGGWVAMWRPIEIFLYDWWPIRAEARLYDRLGSMPVNVTYPGS
jgi:hypothetical protein